MRELEELQDWYSRQCEGEWEHERGVSIDTLDNPGWSVAIDLAGAGLAETPIEELVDRLDGETDWMTCRRTAERFEGACGPRRLGDALRVVLDWARANGGGGAARRRDLRPTCAPGTREE